MTKHTIERDFLIYPNVPMNMDALVTVLALVISVAVICCVLFAILGAWPVSGFLGLDIAGLVVALWWTRRKSLVRERILIRDQLLFVERRRPSGIEEVSMFETVHVRVFPEYIKGSGLGLVCGERSVSVGEFLTKVELISLERELRAAIKG